MDVSSAFKSEIFRPLTTIAVPGALALGPYVIIAQHYAPCVRTFWHEHDSAFTAVVVVLVLAAGLILEDLGSQIEIWIDSHGGMNEPNRKAEWAEYLALKLKDDIIGQRYLRTVLVRLKFELSMVPALMALGIGLIWVQVLFRVWSLLGIFLVSLFLVALCGYLLFEAFQSAETLRRIRKAIVIAARAPSA